MRRTSAALALGLWLAIGGSAMAGSPLSIILHDPDEWGEGGRADILKVLHSATQPLWSQFPHRDLSPIRVESRGGPIVLHRRTIRGEYIVRLNTGDLFWSQYIYQFSHEFCHILCRGKIAENPNAWFEEAVCEAASLYTLRSLAEGWTEKPPYPNWKSYAPKLGDYAGRLIEKTEEEADLGAWYARHRDELRRDATNRPLNRVVSVALLPLLEEKPERWRSFAYLNRGNPNRERNLKTYFLEWRKNAPREHSGWISQVAGLFGIEIRD